jgi:hypothetical protein
MLKLDYQTLILFGVLLILIVFMNKVEKEVKRKMNSINIHPGR